MFIAIRGGTTAKQQNTKNIHPRVIFVMGFCFASHEGNRNLLMFHLLLVDSVLRRRVNEVRRYLCRAGTAMPSDQKNDKV